MSQGDPYPDYFNPILVKELRQGLRSKSYTAILLITQGVAAFFNFVCMMAGSSLRAQESSGLLAVGLFAVFIIALPLTSLNAIGGELSRDTFPLVRMSHLDGWRVLYGKWVARSAETLLLAVSLLPHFILRFFLGGTDIAGELSYFAVCLLASVVFTAVAIACSVQRNWLLRIALLVALVAGVLASNTAVFMLQINTLSGRVASGFITLKPDFLDGPGAILLATAVNLVCVAVLLFWAAERLALTPVTYQPRLRLFALGGCFVFPAALFADAYFHGSFNFNGPPLCAFLTTPLPMVSLLILLHGLWSEPPSLLPRPAGWKRIWLFRPGWPGGIWFFCLVYGLIVTAIVSVMAGIGWDRFSPRELADTLYGVLGVATIALGSLLLWRLGQKKVAWPPWLWLAIWLIVGVCFLAWSTMDSPNSRDFDALARRFLGHAFFGIGFLDVVDNSGRIPELTWAVAPFWAIWTAFLAYVALRIASRRILVDDKALAASSPTPASPATSHAPSLSV